jgi:phosphate/sulfate permease
MGIFLLWILLSFIVGAIGSDRELGFFWSIFISLTLSPIIGFIAVLSSKRKSDVEHQKRVEQLLKQQNEALKK